MIMIAYLLTATLLLSPTAFADAPAEGDAPAQQQATVGQKAPDFTLPTHDAAGAFTLSEYAGKTVVLEWFNPACPFVVSAHEKDGVLEKMAKKVSSDDVVWIAVNSTSDGHKGHTPDDNTNAKKEWKMDHHVVLDADGAVGHTYNARTTPHMYVVAPDGTLAYDGAIDNHPRGKGEGKHVNYVQDALDAIAAGEEVKNGKTKPYGCSVKYAD
jgi:peroxiredoxin